MRDAGARRSRRRWAVIALWAVLLLLFWFAAQRHSGGPVALLAGWLATLSRSPAAPLLLIGLYLLRPLLLLPVTLLTVFSGFLLGVLGGGLLALFMTLASASVAYGLARRLGPTRAPGGALFERLEAHTFEAVLTARLTFVPGDLVNYAAGAVRVPYPPFALATLLGGLPGLAMGVLAGASIEGVFRFDGVRIEPALLLGSFALLLFSLLASWLLRRRSSR